MVSQLELVHVSIFKILSQNLLPIYRDLLMSLLFLCDFHVFSRLCVLLLKN